jgi:glucose/arabinose dehydrogenase
MLLRRLLCLALPSAVGLIAAAGASAATLPAGFQEQTVFSGLTNPTAVDFSSDGRVFVAEKSGLIKVFDGVGDTTPTTFADLRTNVHNFWDRGLLGMELAPNFPADPHVYVLYTHDAAIGGTAPRWGTVGGTSDGCPTPPGPTDDGCVVSGRLSRLTASGNTMTGPEQVLIEDWCQQYPSHSVGDLKFGADGALYVSAGDGASFLFSDYGQAGSPKNPCGDPSVPVGGTQTPPTAEGGALRSQDVRTGGSSGGSPGGTYILRPNADIPSAEDGWNIGGGTLAWDALNDSVSQPADVPVEQFLYDWTPGKTTEVALTTQALGGATPSGGRAWFYGNVAPGAAVKVEVLWGGSVRGTTTVDGGTDGAGYDWRSIPVTPPDQASVDDLRLRFTITKVADQGSNMFAAYFELNTSGAPVGTDPTGLDGTVLRVDPATGAGLPGNPMASSPDPNARRIVGYGLRNPFRFAIRPGTNELWIGDVGWNDWEEVNRLTTPADSTADNFGWPCYEGNGRQFGYDSADLNLCESLYAAPSVVSPYFTWSHTGKVVSGETCPTGSSSISGADFYTGGPYPDSYDGTMFFADYSRDCIWAMKAQGGLPSPSQVVTFAAGADNPVSVDVGPDGAVYYADFDGGTVRRIYYAAGNQTPNAVANATPTSGNAPLSVQFDAGSSSDPDPGDTLSYAWDLDADGAYDDSTAQKPTRSYSAGTYVVGLKVTDAGGASDTDSVTIDAGNTPPTATILTPATGTLWNVGTTLGFSGSASDAQEGTLGASRLRWDLIMNHCPSTCHTHALQTFQGVSSGSFVAPDHEYPSYLTLRLTATDAGGLTSVVERQLDPRTYLLTFATSNPTGLKLGFNGSVATTRFTRTVIRGSHNSLSAPTPQASGSRTYAFSSWSDGGAQTHNITATANRTYTANFRRVTGVTATQLAACKRKAKGKRRPHRKVRRCVSRMAAG